MQNINIASNRTEFRNWLMANHASAKECWLAIKRGIPKDEETFWYLDAVEEALCFGWIDSTLKKFEGHGTLQRFSPRRPNGNWTELNKERCRRLEKLGLMTEAGRVVLPAMGENSFVADKELLAYLQEEPQAWENFQAMPALYQRVRLDTIQMYKHRPDTFWSKAEKLRQASLANKMIGEWNDRGRLS